MTNGDKIFKAVIEDSALISYGGYNPDDYDSLQNALDDENVVISTVAKIIYYQLRGHSEREIYNEVTNFRCSIPNNLNMKELRFKR